MGDEDQGTQGQGQQQPNQQQAPPAQSPAEQPPPVIQQQGKTMMLTQKSLNERIERAKRSGHKEALDNLVSELGLKNVDDLLKRLKDPPKPPQANNQRSANGGNGRRDGGNARPNGGQAQTSFDKRFEREKQKLQRERDDVAKKARSADRRARQLEDELDVERVNRQLERIALSEGVLAKEVRGALFFLADHLADKSQEYRDKFDEGKFFRESLRAERPYLFGETVTPANTGTGAQPARSPANNAGGNAPPPAPAPGAARQVGAEGQKVDARSMSPEAFRAHLAQRGFNMSIAGQ